MIGRKCIGSVGKVRDIQQIQTVTNEFLQGSDTLDLKTMIEKINNLTSIYRNHHFISSSDILYSIDAELLVCDSYNINIIYSDLSVTQASKFFAIGSGYELALGILNDKLKDVDTECLEEVEARKIVQQCIEQVSNNDIFIDNNVDIKVIYKPALELKTSNPIYIINKCSYELTNNIDNPVYIKCKKKKNVNCTVCDNCYRIVQDKLNNKILKIQKYT